MIYEVIESYKYKDLEKFTYAQLEGETTDNEVKSIIVYSPFETEFLHNGEAVLEQVEGGKIVEELNGDYYLEFIIRKDKRNKYKKIKDLCIIKAQDQLFRVPSMEYVKDNGFSISVYAKHIWYDINEIFTEDRRVNEQTVDVALSRILEGDVNNRFVLGLCDVLTVANANFIDENADVSVFDKIIPRWGGELFRNNYHFAMKQRLGKYKPEVQLRYGKNARGIKKKVDYMEVCTRIFPYGKDGISVSEANGGVRFLESDNIKSYPRFFTKRVKFEGIETSLEVKQEALKYLEKHKKPLMTLDVDCIDLCYRKEYEQLKKAIELNLGDTISVYDEDLLLNEEVRVIKKEICPVTGMTLSITLGDKALNIAQKITDTETKVDDTSDRVDEISTSGDSNNQAIIELGNRIDSVRDSVAGLNQDIGGNSKEIVELKLDVGDKNDLISEDKSSLVNAMNEHRNNYNRTVLDVGDVSQLSTVYKDNIVGAVNELSEKSDIVKYKVEVNIPNVNDYGNGESVVYGDKLYIKIGNRFMVSTLVPN